LGDKDCVVSEKYRRAKSTDIDNTNTRMVEFPRATTNSHTLDDSSDCDDASY